MKINVAVKPNSKKGPKVEAVDVRRPAEVVVYVREVAADGAANEALIKILAKHYGVPKSRVKIIRGQTARRKLVEVENS